MSSSTHSDLSNMSRSPSQVNCMDPLDAMLDFSEYDKMSSFTSPSISPSASSKSQFARPAISNPHANTLISSSQPLSGPSHDYEMYKQQTGIPSGALSSTLAMNPTNMYFNNYSGINTDDEFLDFNSGLNSYDGLNGGSAVSMNFDTPSVSPAFFFPDQTLGSSSEFVNPSVIGGQEVHTPAPMVVPTQSTSMVRAWPGMHQQQAALQKAQQQQKQQQQLIQQQRQQSLVQQGKPRSKSHQATDPIVEEKISQLLQSMRQSSVSTSADDDSNAAGLAHVHRMRKEEEDMDEDERLLASEEGKKLSSKERRQLRNKVSARAFRSRRKEYIGQLEGEIAQKVSENSDLRIQNRALLEENTRLSDLTRMLLSSPSFSGFLDTLTPTAATQSQQAQPTPTPAPQQQQPQQQKVRKDINPYAAQAQLNATNTRINMALIPEQSMDFNMLDLGLDNGFTYQPQVFSVLSLPETPVDISILSGKSSNSVPTFFSNDEKVEIPALEPREVKEVEVVETEEEVVDEEFDADPLFALYNRAPAAVKAEEAVTEALPFDIDFSLIRKPAQFELVVEAEDASAIEEFRRSCAKLESILGRVEALTVGS